MSKSCIRLGIVSTHPIQYFSSLYRLLNADGWSTEVLYLQTVASSGDGRSQIRDSGFGRDVTWDVDLLSGYHWATLNLNASRAGKVPTSEFGKLGVRFRKWLKRFGPDVVLIPGWTPPYVVIREVCSALGIPYIIRPEARSRTSRGIKGKLGGYVASRFVRNAGSSVAIGSRARDELVRLGAKSRHVFWGPYAVDNNWWISACDSSVGRRPSVRERLGVTNDETLFIYVGKMAGYKRVPALIDCFALALREGHRCKLLLVGTGQEEEQIKALVREKNLGGKVIFAGFANQTELPILYSAADALVLFSSETWGLVVNEAMCFGLPVVASLDVGSSRDLIVDGATGFRVDPKDRERTARSLGRLCDPGLRDDMKPAIANVIREYGLGEAAQGIMRAAWFAAGKGQRGATTTD